MIHQPRLGLYDAFCFHDVRDVREVHDDAFRDVHEVHDAFHDAHGVEQQRVPHVDYDVQDDDAFRGVRGAVHDVHGAAHDGHDAVHGGHDAVHGGHDAVHDGHDAAH